LQLQGPGKEHSSVGVAYELSERDAEQLQQVGIVRRTSQQCLIARDCLAQPAGTMVANRAGEACTVSAVGGAHEFVEVHPRRKGYTTEYSSRLRPDGQRDAAAFCFMLVAAPAQ
jgi:hypothetical protein